jgi:hypothetical protein
MNEMTLTSDYASWQPAAQLFLFPFSPVSRRQGHRAACNPGWTNKASYD